jgi:hypothetical protein
MNYLDVNQQTQNSLTRRQNASIFNNWEESGRQISSLAVASDDIDGYDESFASQSKVLPILLKSVAAKEMSIMDMITLVQSAKAIEEGDTKAATFVRDTSGGKPVEKQQEIPRSKYHELTDAQIEYLLNHSEVDDD